MDAKISPPEDRCFTFTAEATDEQVQASIDDNDGCLLLRIPAAHARGFENLTVGDGAVVELAGQGDATCWIGDVGDVEGRPGFDKFVIIDIR